MRLRLGLSIVAAGVVAALAGTAAPAGVRGTPSVLIIGDSVATGMQWHGDAVSVVQKDLDVSWQVAVCRRLTGAGCTFQGVTPTSLVPLVRSLGTVPPIVVVEMGYNDHESTFAASVEQSIQTLLQHGAQHVLWLTLREVHHPYIPMNGILAAEARKHPQLRLVDWNTYARSHPEWFQSDGEHLLDAGGVGMATLIHLAIDEVTRPLWIVPRRVGLGRVGARYSADLAARGGYAPYTWRLVGSPPAGLHLLADGSIYGTPRRVQRATVIVRVSDSEGQVASKRLVIAVLRPQ